LENLKNEECSKDNFKKYKNRVKVAEKEGFTLDLSMKKMKS
jgi:hypothetical protein